MCQDIFGLPIYGIEIIQQSLTHMDDFLIEMNPTPNLGSGNRVHRILKKYHTYAPTWQSSSVSPSYCHAAKDDSVLCLTRIRPRVDAQHE